MKRKVVFGAVLLFCATLMISQIIISVNNSELNPTTDIQQSRRKRSNPIIIDGDDDFADQKKKYKWTGSGTITDPYIIENYDIDIPYHKKKAVPPAAISISNTTVYFIIRDSTMSNFNGDVDGIILWNVINGQIYRNTITNFVNGIFLINSNDIIITDNNIQGYSESTSMSLSSQNIRYKVERVQVFISRGVFLDPSNHNIITDNTIGGYTGTGVELLDSSDNLIDGNIIDNTIGENGVFLAESDYNTITNNDVFAYSSSSSPLSSSSQNVRYKVESTQVFISRGVFLDPSNHNVISNNTISGYIGTGVELLDSSDNLIDGNVIANDGGETGVFLAGSDYNTIINNDVLGYSTSSSPLSSSSGNIRYKVESTQVFISRGVFLDPSNHNVIANNTIAGYTGTGVELLDSSDNLIDGNVIDNAAGENGVFLAGSDYNCITNNNIYDSGAATSTSLSSQNIRYKVEGAQVFISRGVFLDPSNHNIVANNSISGYTGTGVELLDSSDNLIDGNVIDNSAGENGVFLASSDYNNITNNAVYDSGATASTSLSSQNIRYKVESTQVFISRGVFLDPSNHNIIADNYISGYTGTGVELLNSSDNLIDGNVIDNAVGENGVFLAGSDYNSITNNAVYDSGATTSASLSLQNIRYKVEGAQVFISRGVFLDPSNHNTITNNYISGFTGTGVELLDSSDNLIDSNVIDNAAGENGVFLAGSDYNSITNNNIYDSGAATSTGFSSQNIRYKVEGAQVFISRGVFLDPSNHNVIANNAISGYTGTGVELLDSSDNLIDGNVIDNSAGENGVFLAGSDYNSIINNDVTGCYGDSTPMSIASQNIRFKIERTQVFISRGVFLDPSNHNIIANNTISNITGTGVELLGSSDNIIDGNEISNNAESGILLQESSSTNISNNVIYNDDLHGITINDASTNNAVNFNDLIGNNLGGSSQILDNGSDNQFSYNFLVDHDNTDNDNDSLSDNPYYIDGDASSADYNPNSLPVKDLTKLDITFADLEAWVDYESETLNLKNEGNWENVKIKLPEGYSVTNINVSTVYTDGMIFAEEAQVQNERTLIVKFDRQALISYIETLNLPYFPIDLKLNVTGLLNGDFMMFYGFDYVTILNGETTSTIITTNQKLE